MIVLLVRKLALTLLLALAIVALLERFNPTPPPLLVDFHRADFHRAQQPVPDDARPVLQRCNPIASGDQPMAAIGIEQEPVT